MTDHQPEAPALPGVTRWHPKPAAAEAHRWRKNGDHPADNCRMITPDPQSTTQFAPFLSEGEIVRYYRHPCDDGKRECGDCGARMHDHGWIDQGMMGRVVCPGDWVVSLALTTPGLVAYIPVKPDVFAAAYEPAPEPLILPPDEFRAVQVVAAVLGLPGSASEPDGPGEASTELRRLEAAVTSGDALIREILEALCRRDGLPLESSVVAGEPARNYDLAIRLGIGHVFGIQETPGA